MTSSRSTDEHKVRAQDISARCAIVTCSDTRIRESDISGRKIESLLLGNGHSIIDYRLVEDDPQRVRSALSTLIEQKPDVILLNGGTGIAPRDVTYDVVSAMLEKTLPGFGELFRVLSYNEVGSAAMLSRATAGIIGQILIFSLPGSPNAVSLAMEKLIIPELQHLVWELNR